MEAPITVVLVAITTLISLMAFQRYQVFEELLFRPYAVQHRGEWYRLFTHAFIHADWGHLIVNMFVLFMFGGDVEYLYSVVSDLPVVVTYPVLYVGGILFATLPGMAKQRDNSGYRSVGASGAVSAVLFAQIMLLPLEGIDMLFVEDIPAWVFGILYLVYSYAMDKRGRDNVAHDAHFYGAVFGLLFSAALYPKALSNIVELIRSVFAWA